MPHVKNFFHDRFVLFILTINTFILVVTILTVLLRIGGDANTYVQYYRSNLGLAASTVGGVSEIIAFLVFAVGLYTAHIFIGINFYKVRKSIAWTALLMTTFLLILNVLVVNVLLNLH